METKDYGEIPYTIEIDWINETVWLNNHVAKRKNSCNGEKIQNL